MASPQVHTHTQTRRHTCIILIMHPMEQSVQILKWLFWGATTCQVIRFLLSHPNLEGLSLPPKTCLLFSLFHFVSVAFRSSIRKRMSNYINSNRFESSLFSRRLFHLYTAAQNESQVNKNHQWHLAKPIFKNRTSPFDMKNT